MSGSDTLSDAIIAGSAGGELADAIHASRRKKRSRPSAFSSPHAPGQCANCGTTLAGPVCHSCGQTADTFHRPIWELFMEILDGLFGFEGRLWRTIPPLMLQPGKITLQYLSGVRARYVRPFRLYLTVSVVLFFILFAFQGLVPDAPTETGPGTDPARAALQEVANRARDGSLDAELAGQGISEANRTRLAETLTNAEQMLAGAPGEGEPVGAEGQVRGQEARQQSRDGIRRALLPEDYPAEPDAGTSEPDAGAPVGATGLNIDGHTVDEVPIEARRQVADTLDRIIDDNGRALALAMQRWAPRLMFALLPLYALMLAFMHFYKRGYYFYDHLVVSLHFHAALALMFITFLIASRLIGPGLPAAILFVWSNYYLYRLHRVVYRHGRVSSLLRTVVMDLAYSIVLSIGFLILVILGAMTA
jgi:hypothetical protein